VQSDAHLASLPAAQPLGQARDIDTEQPPEPSQTPAGVSRLLLQLAVTQMIELSGYVQAAVLTPLHALLQGPFPAHAARGATGSPVTAVHFPRLLHVSHCPSQALSQQILSVQLLLSHSEPAEQTAPNPDLVGCEAPARPTSVSPPGDPPD
jgi:hypothetical protein